MVWMAPEKFVNGAAAHSDTVRNYLDELTFQMLAHAEAGLVEHRHDGHATVSREHDAQGAYPEIDWLVTLSDERGQLAALSIEYGHGEYEREVVDKHGNVRVITVGASRPTYILTNATKIAKKGGKSVSGKKYRANVARRRGS